MTPAELEAIRERVRTGDGGIEKYTDRRTLLAYVDELLSDVRLVERRKLAAERDELNAECQLAAEGLIKLASRTSKITSERDQLLEVVAAADVWLGNEDAVTRRSDMPRLDPHREAYRAVRKKLEDT